MREALEKVVNGLHLNAIEEACVRSLFFEEEAPSAKEVVYGVLKDAVAFYVPKVRQAGGKPVSKDIVYPGLIKLGPLLDDKELLERVLDDVISHEITVEDDEELTEQISVESTLKIALGLVEGELEPSVSEIKNEEQCKEVCVDYVDKYLTYLLLLKMRSGRTLEDVAADPDTANIPEALQSLRTALENAKLHGLPVHRYIEDAIDALCEEGTDGRRILKEILLSTKHETVEIKAGESVIMKSPEKPISAPKHTRLEDMDTLEDKLHLALQEVVNAYVRMVPSTGLAPDETVQDLIQKTQNAGVQNLPIEMLRFLHEHAQHNLELCNQILDECLQGVTQDTVRTVVEHFVRQLINSAEKPTPTWKDWYIVKLWNRLFGKKK